MPAGQLLHATKAMEMRLLSGFATCTSVVAGRHQAPRGMERLLEVEDEAEHFLVALCRVGGYRWVSVADQRAGNRFWAFEDLP